MYTTIIYRRPDVARLICAWLLTVLLTAAADAANLTLVSDAPPGNPLVIAPSDTSTPLLVSVVNDVDSDAPEDYLTAWQVRLEIVADTGATGTLEFQGAGEPENYVFEGTANIGVSVTNSGDLLFGLDFNFPDTGGVQVPTSPGANLLAITLDPSAGALGRFGIFVVAVSEWTDAAPIEQQRAFANVPDGGGPVRIADVVVTSSSSGDFNGDGVVNAADYTVWRDGLGSIYNQTQYGDWKRQFGAGGSLAGDYNGDGTVGAADYAVWRDNTSGQFTSADYHAWRENFGAAITGGAVSANVPEPATCRLVLLAVVSLVGGRWTRSRRGNRVHHRMSRICELVRSTVNGEENKSGDREFRMAAALR